MATNRFTFDEALTLLDSSFSVSEAGELDNLPATSPPTATSSGLAQTGIMNLFSGVTRTYLQKLN